MAATVATVTLTYILPYRPRPLFGAGEHFLVPYGLEASPDPAGATNSFPSDHATLFVGKPAGHARSPSCVTQCVRAKAAGGGGAQTAPALQPPAGICVSLRHARTLRLHDVGLCGPAEGWQLPPFPETPVAVTPVPTWVTDEQLSETDADADVPPEQELFMSSVAAHVAPVIAPQLQLHEAGGTSNPSLPSRPTDG